MATVLVTGGAGFIGSHIVDALILRGFRIIVLDNLSTGKLENIHPEAVFMQLDICSPGLRNALAHEKIDWVCHHAAQIDVRQSIAHPQQDAKTNILGLLNLLSYCVSQKIKGIVFASSGGAVYGEPDKLPVLESCPKDPLSPYGVSKLSSEYYLYNFHRIHNLPYIALRYGNVYGPRQFNNGETGVISIFIEKMLAGEAPIIYGDGNQTRDYVYIGDIVTANLLALNKLTDLRTPSKIDDNAFNIGTGIGISVNDLFSQLKGIIGFSQEAKYAAARPGEVRKMNLSNSKARESLSWQPQVSLSEGLKKLVGCYAEKGANNMVLRKR